MSKPRKSWEPEYRFGGNPADFYTPNPLGRNQSPYHTKLKSNPKVKRKKR